MCLLTPFVRSANELPRSPSAYGWMPVVGGRHGYGTSYPLPSVVALTAVGPRMACLARWFASLRAGEGLDMASGTPRAEAWGEMTVEDFDWPRLGTLESRR